MKHIVKGTEPASFASWKASHPAAKYQDLNLPGNRAVKAELKRSLLTEQGYICCYCEREVAENTSHIEHFKPKDSNQPYVGLQLDYNNLHACCNLRPSAVSPNICGVKKGATYSTDLISPMEVDCATHFIYAYDGSVRAVSGDRRATYTIRLLDLDNAFLRALREAVIAPFLDEELTADDIAILRNDYLRPGADGHFKEFYTTIEQLF